MKPKKPSAADITIDLFAPPPVETLPEYEKAERTTIPEDADRMRDQAFKVQEWTTAAFGIPSVGGNQYRVSRNGDHFYVETVSNSRYCGLMVHKNDLLNMTTVLVSAARDLKERIENGFD